MNKTKYIKQVFMCLSVLAASNAWATSTSFNSEAGLFYLDSDNSSAVYMYGRYYLAPVSTEEHPLAEANFFSRSASIGGSFGMSDFDSASINHERDNIRIDYSHVKKSSPLTFGISYSKSDGDIVGGGSSGSSDRTGYSLNVGYFLDNNSYMNFSFYNSDATYSHPSYPSESENSQYSLGYKQIIEYSDNTALSIRGHVSINESSTDGTPASDDSRYILYADYYFNRNFNLSVSLASTSSDSASIDGTEYGIGFGYFFTEKFQLTASYDKFNSEAGGESDDDTLFVSASYRF